MQFHPGMHPVFGSRPVGGGDWLGTPFSQWLLIAMSRGAVLAVMLVTAGEASSISKTRRHFPSTHLPLAAVARRALCFARGCTQSLALAPIWGVDWLGTPRQGLSLAIARRTW